ncbi:helix-turn-helix domain-containing protein [Salinimonas marina]|uniref:histidine kinase n=1 Tax=Salinimonas marina TaxID=2785918 RepID=A0A7S9DY77_9ALTE|nr:helix-turn-helix domain-containing protein [Salinimonas marina]QPG05485.1 helix-turn-helix domain-containing protein [Salinimonas marina]
MKKWIFVLILILAGFIPGGQASNLVPMSFSKVFDGKSTGVIWSIQAGSDGVWLGSENGLFGLIGNKTIVFDDENSILRSNFVIDIAEFSSGKYWVSVNGDGIYELDRQSRKISRVSPDIKDIAHVQSVRTTDENIVINTVRNLYVLDKETLDVKFSLDDIAAGIDHEVVDVDISGDEVWWLDHYLGLRNLSISSKAINTFDTKKNFSELERVSAFLIEDDALIVAGLEAVYSLSRSTGKVNLVLTRNRTPSTTPRQPIQKLKRDPVGTLWAAAERLFVVDEKKHKLTAPPHLHPLLASSLVEIVLDFDFDNAGGLYGADTQKGLFYLSEKSKATSLLGHDLTLSGKNYSDIEIGTKGDIISGGLGTLTISKKSSTKNKVINLNTEAFIYLLNATDDFIDVISGDGQIFRVRPQGEEVYLQGHLTEFDNSFDYVESVVRDGEGQSAILVASHTEKKVILYKNGAMSSVAGGDIKRLSFSKAGMLLVAITSDGIYKIDFSEHGNQATKISDLLFSDASCLYESQSLAIWICTPGQGLLKIIEGKPFSYSERFPFKYIRGLAEIDENIYLITTNSGLYIFNDTTFETLRIHTSYGISDVDFEYNSVTSGSEISVIAGDIFTYVINDKLLLQYINEARYELNEVAIVDVKTFNKSINNYLNIKHRLVKYSNFEEITLTADEAFIDLHLSIANLNEHMYLNFEYRLKGMNDFWIVSEYSSSKLVFSSLPHGNYTLEARVTNPYHPQPVTRLRIVVLPPWWLSPLAYAIYAAMLMIMVGYAALRLKRRDAEQGKVLKGQVEEKHSLLEDTQNYIHHILDRKQQIFTNLSRQLQTPLTLISGPVRQIIENPEDEETPRRLEMIEDNTNRLHLLVSQIIEIDRLESIQKLPCQNYNLNTIFQHIVGNLRSLAESNNQRLEAHIRTRGEIYLLRDSLETILLHLVSNALHCTPPEGKVQISARCKGLQLIIAVTDNVGLITPTQAETIFQRFTQQNESGATSGGDIGLALVKELVLANQGWIDIETKSKKATCFNVYLPLVSLEENGSSPLAAATSTPPRKSSSQSSLRPNILIVDDDAALRSYLKERLGADYCCIEASSVQAALEVMKLVTVALVVCDLRMPEENGFKLREKMQDQVLWRDLPFILLATPADEAEFEGPVLNCMDAIVSKPVDTVRLQRQVEGILARQKSRQLSGKAPAADENTPFTLPTFANARDQAFYMRFLKLLADHYQDDSFSRTFAAQQMATSERQMLRKLNALFGFNFTDTLKLYRLHRAKALLREGAQVTQVAYEVGFGTASYFSSCFKAQVNESPRQYQERCQQVSVTAEA